LTQTILHVSKKTSRTADQHELGRRVAELLTGAWRESEVTPRSLSETQLAEIVPLLCESGAGALAWWRLRNTSLANTESGQQLHDVYRRHRLSALIHEREIAYVLSLLRTEGIEPVLIKGWAISRLYPDAGLRPYGDIDLCIRPDQFAAASAALKCLEEMEGRYVDLHSGFARIGQTRPEDGSSVSGRFRIDAGEMRVWHELFSRSQVVPLHQSKVQGPKSKLQLPNTDFGPWTLDFGQTVRVLSHEDHLRILSAHLLRSGARRPPWLCDIALLLDKVQSPKSKVQSRSFDWDVCLRDRLHHNWTASAVMLAHELLGADISHTPFAIRRAPAWLAPAVLRQWGRSRVQSPKSKVQSHISPRRLWTLDLGLWTKLDNPVRATAAVGGQFNNWPRLPYRVAELVMRLPEIPAHLVSLQQFAAQRSNSEATSPSPVGAARWNASLSPD
jgi:hypothetical protein